MKKYIMFSALLAVALSSSAQSNGSMFDETFQGMFDVPNEPIYIAEGVQGPLNPAVPLDGGLTALLLAGGAAGYRQYKKKKA
jgi:hypothetical protein